MLQKSGDVITLKTQIKVSLFVSRTNLITSDSSWRCCSIGFLFHLVFSILGQEDVSFRAKISTLGKSNWLFSTGDYGFQ